MGSLPRNQGCNIPDIDVVVQWKLPSSVSSFVQRAGRAARGKGCTGLALLLVEKSAYEVDITRLDTETTHRIKPNARKSASKSKCAGEKTTYLKAGTKTYAANHGVGRGSYGGVHDELVLKESVPLHRDLPDEGLYSLVQTGTCRRLVLTEVFGNGIPCKCS